MEAVVLDTVGFLANFCPKQGQDFKPSAAPLYPIMGQVHPPPPGMLRPSLVPSPQAICQFALMVYYSHLYSKVEKTNVRVNCLTQGNSPGLSRTAIPESNDLLI